MARQLTKKQKTFVETYAETGNGVKSALTAYDTEDYGTANSIATENLQKPAIRNYLMEALPDDLLARVHKEGLEATMNEGLDPDYSTRHKYLDTAYKLKGSYAAEKSINMNVSAKDLQETIMADIARFRAKE